VLFFFFYFEHLLKEIRISAFLSLYPRETPHTILDSQIHAEWILTSMQCDETRSRRFLFVKLQKVMRLSICWGWEIPGWRRVNFYMI